MYKAKAYSAASETSPLALTTIPRRDPTARDVQLEILYAGICHSDLHIQAGGFDMGGGKLSSLERAGATLPLTMGHEIGGEVVEVGPEVSQVRIGDRVVVHAGIVRPA